MLSASTLRKNLWKVMQSVDSTATSSSGNFVVTIVKTIGVAKLSKDSRWLIVISMFFVLWKVSWVQKTLLSPFLKNTIPVELLFQGR